jgi:hypothetical protein
VIVSINFFLFTDAKIGEMIKKKDRNRRIAEIGLLKKKKMSP